MEKAMDYIRCIDVDNTQAQCLNDCNTRTVDKNPWKRLWITLDV